MLCRRGPVPLPPPPIPENPSVLVTGGGPADLLHASDGIMRLRGKWQVHRTQGGVEIPTMPTLHPAYLLRKPEDKAKAWVDLQLAMRSSVPDPA